MLCFAVVRIIVWEICTEDEVLYGYEYYTVCYSIELLGLSLRVFVCQMHYVNEIHSLSPRLAAQYIKIFCLALPVSPY